MRIDPSWVLFLIQEYPLKEGRVIVFIMFYLNPCQASCNLVTSYMYVLHPYFFQFWDNCYENSGWRRSPDRDDHNYRLLKNCNLYLYLYLYLYLHLNLHLYLYCLEDCVDRTKLGLLAPAFWQYQINFKFYNVINVSHPPKQCKTTPCRLGDEEDKISNGSRFQDPLWDRWVGVVIIWMILILDGNVDQDHQDQDHDHHDDESFRKRLLDGFSISTLLHDGDDGCGQRLWF